MSGNPLTWAEQVRATLYNDTIGKVVPAPVTDILVQGPIAGPISEATGHGIAEQVSGSSSSGSGISSGVTSTGSPFQNFTSWLPYFLLIGGALLLVNQGKYAGVGNAMAALVVAAYGFKNWNGIVTGFDNTFGTGIAQSASVPS